MEKNVTAGMRNTSITLDGTECPVTFSDNYRCFEVLNDSDDDVTASIYKGKTSGEDGVLTVHPGVSATIAHMRTDIDTVYVNGTGTVQVAAKNTVEPVFKIRSGGGDNKPSSKDYVQDGLIAEWILDGNENETLTNPLFVTDSNLGRTVGKIINGADSFYVKKDSLGGTGDSGMTLQCLVNCSSFPSQSSFFAIGQNNSPVTALGIGANSGGKIMISAPNDNKTIDYTMADSVWYHLAAVYNNSTESIVTYVNGDPVSTISKSLQISSLKSGAAIGTWVWSSAFPNPSRYNQGDFRIANCCVYDRPLSNEEIAENYAVDKKRYGIGG